MPLMLAIFAFFYFLSDHKKDKDVRRYRETYIYKPDSLGNYEQYFNPNDPGNRSELLPGNTAYSETFLIRDGLQKNIGRPKPGTTINQAGRAYSVTFQSSVDDAHLLSEETAFQPETEISEAEMIEKLRLLKQKGSNQTEAIYVATGCKPGAAPLYKWAVEVWKSIPVEGRILK